MTGNQVLDLKKNLLRCDDCGATEPTKADILGKTATPPDRDPAFDAVKAQAEAFAEKHAKCEKREPDTLERVRTIVGSILDGDGADSDGARELATEIRAIDEKLVAADLLPARAVDVDILNEPGLEKPDHLDYEAVAAYFEKIAIADHRLREGKAILTWQIRGYRDHDSVEIDLEKPLLVRVSPTAEDSLTHWSDRGWLDPYWDIEILGEIPEEAKGCSSIFMDGPIYNTRTGHVTGYFIDAPVELGGIA